MIILLVLLAGLPVVGNLEFRLVDDATESWGVLHWPVLAGEPEVVERINFTVGNAIIYFLKSILFFKSLKSID